MRKPSRSEKILMRWLFSISYLRTSSDTIEKPSPEIRSCLENETEAGGSSFCFKDGTRIFKQSQARSGFLLQRKFISPIWSMALMWLSCTTTASAAITATAPTATAAAWGWFFCNIDDKSPTLMELLCRCLPKSRCKCAQLRTTIYLKEFTHKDGLDYGV